MGSNRKQAGRPPGEAQLSVEKEAERRKLSGPETQTSPRAGRTGGLGSRAERPSEGRHRQTTQKQAEPGRSSKAPSAAGRDTGAPPSAGPREAGHRAAGQDTRRAGKPDQPDDRSVPQGTRDTRS